MNSESLFLSKDVSFCFADDYCIFLDLRQDEYLCSSRREVELLGPHLVGWNSNSNEKGFWRTELPEEIASLAQQLLVAGILTTDRTHAKEAQAECTLSPRRAIESCPAISRRHALRFLIPFLRASRSANSLLRQPIDHVVKHVTHRKSIEASDGSFDCAKAAPLVAIFNSLRYTFPRNYLCLFDSLALFDFLSRYGLVADWVFGVHADPFEAHCWLQAHDVVLNDSVEHVSAFTPIMTV